MRADGSPTDPLLPGSTPTTAHLTTRQPWTTTITTPCMENVATPTLRRIRTHHLLMVIRSQVKPFSIKKTIFEHLQRRHRTSRRATERHRIEAEEAEPEPLRRIEEIQNGTREKNAPSTGTTGTPSLNRTLGILFVYSSRSWPPYRKNQG